MQGQIVHLVITLCQDRCLPVRKGRHHHLGTAAGHQFNRGVHPFHHLGRLIGQPPVLICGLVPHLPRAVHLIAQAPCLYVVGFLFPMGPSKVTPVTAFPMVTVFHQIPGRVRSPGSQVHCQHQP